MRGVEREERDEWKRSAIISMQREQEDGTRTKPLMKRKDRAELHNRERGDVQHTCHRHVRSSLTTTNYFTFVAQSHCSFKGITMGCNCLAV